MERARVCVRALLPLIRPRSASLYIIHRLYCSPLSHTSLLAVQLKIWLFLHLLFILTRHRPYRSLLPKTSLLAVELWHMMFLLIIFVTRTTHWPCWSLSQNYLPPSRTAGILAIPPSILFTRTRHWLYCKKLLALQLKHRLFHSNCYKRHRLYCYLQWQTFTAPMFTA